MFQDVARLCSSVSRLKVLKFFLLQPEARAGAEAVASTLGIPKAVVLRELRALAGQGILAYRRQGKTLLWGANTSHPLAQDLRSFLEVATLPEDAIIARAFKNISGITLVVAAGTLARETHGSIDILVVTKKPKDPRIAQAVRVIERTTALPIRYAVLEAVDYAERFEARDRLIRDVLEYTHRIIIGRKN